MGIESHKKLLFFSNTIIIKWDITGKTDISIGMHTFRGVNPCR